MKTAGIIAEFNPFHKGHAYLMEQARAGGADALAVVMSGHFTQRGEPACMQESVRCEAALRAGADLVIELPLPWAMASADVFAYGAVYLLYALGCVDRLVFGSECGDVDTIRACARMLCAADGDPLFAAALAQGYSFPRARLAAVRALFPQGDVSLLTHPNDTLAVSYLRACEKVQADFSLFAVRRLFTAHDRDDAPHGFASAARIRALLAAGQREHALSHVPKEAAEVYRRALSVGAAPFRGALAERAVLSRLRAMDAPAFARTPDVSEGLENRLVSLAGRATGLEQLYKAIKTKRYTHARVRRIVWGAYLGLTRMHTAAPPPYLRVIGIGARGNDILREAGRTKRLPVVSRHADIAPLGTFAKSIYALECRASDLYGLFLPVVQPAGVLQSSPVLHLPAYGSAQNMAETV